MKRKVTGASFIIALLLSVTQLMLVNLAIANPAVYLPVIVIKSDGTVEPETQFIKQDGNVYTLTADLPQKYAIKIQCSNVVFDGAGHSIIGSQLNWAGGYANRGLSLEGVTNVTVKDIEVTGFSGGYLDSWLADVSAENATNSVFLRVTANVLQLLDSNFSTIGESNISSDNSLSFTQLRVLSSNNNTIMGNNIVSLYLDFGYNNTFFKNNFLIGYFSVNEGNFWDNGSVGNYWSGYDGTDVNGDGIGDTPHLINANDQDRFPLMNPWDPVIPFDTVPPRISILSPENKICNESSVPLTFLIYEASSLMSYSLDGQDNVTITGNTTLSGLPNGSHNLTVYMTDSSGNTGVSETIYFNVDAPELFPVVSVAAVSGVTSTAVAVCLLYYHKKHLTIKP